MENTQTKAKVYKTHCELCLKELREGICVNELCKMGNIPYNVPQEINKYVFFDR